MKYLGSKARHADEILAIILAKRQPGQTYVEPFVGGGNVICRVPDAQGPRIGADLNRYMVALHTALGNGWQPPRDVSEAEYKRIKRNPDAHPPELVAFCATGLTFGSLWFDTYIKPEKEGDSRCRQSADSCLRDAPGLKGATFVHSSYDKLEIPPRSLIYCDPPYVGTAGYTGAVKTIKVGESLGSGEWKAAPFWKWADRMVDEGHTVFVSEYTGPQASHYAGNIKPSEELQAARAAVRALQADPDSPSEAFEPAHQRIHAAEAAQLESAQAMADRWRVMWSKEVVGDFNITRGQNAKQETEKLFHREA